MELVKTFGDIRVGDRVRLMLGEPILQVLEVQRTANLGCWIHLRLSPERSVEYWRAQPDTTPIVLVQRPWADQANEIVARIMLTERLENLVGRAAAIRKPLNGDEVREAREAIEAYELGKPEATS